MPNKLSNWFNKQLKNRKLIEKEERNISLTQIIGFGLILLGVLYILYKLIYPCRFGNSPINGDKMALSFFIIMLGVSFAFPSLLLDKTKGLSTMRIVAFMFTNVICMLLLKIGWGNNIKSLTQIGLDGWWMGIIAFVFGGKATQAYFENANKFFPKTQQYSEENLNRTESSKDKNLNISQIAIAQIAKVQFEEKLLSQFSSIESVSDTLKNGESCLTLYLKDDTTMGIPSYVNAELNETTIIKVQTEIVTNIGESKPHIVQLKNDISNSNTPDFRGSICGLIESQINAIKAVLTSGHVFTDGRFTDFDGFVSSSQAYDTLSNGNSIGELYFQQMIPNQDIAFVKLNDTTTLPSQLKKFPNGFYKVSTSDLNSLSENVTILSKDNNQRDAFIIDFNISIRVYYVGTGSNGIIMRNIILIGSNTDKNKSKTVSVEGDSGSCVYHKESEKMIGMLTGGNDKFSFVLPFEQTLINNNFKLA